MDIEEILRVSEREGDIPEGEIDGLARGIARARNGADGGRHQEGA
ncbi:MAG: hypothetical protein OXE82_02585 [Rhodobacter sp.]|nr:hypothetical protein [Rhodobacter sp.]